MCDEDHTTPRRHLLRSLKTTTKGNQVDLHTYTVIGVHDEGEGNRFAEGYEATDPDAAELLALHDHPELLIAGVVEGECKLVDNDPAIG